MARQQQGVGRRALQESVHRVQQRADEVRTQPTLGVRYRNTAHAPSSSKASENTEDRFASSSMACAEIMSSEATPPLVAPRWLMKRCCMRANSSRDLAQSSTGAAGAAVAAAAVAAGAVTLAAGSEAGTGFAAVAPAVTGCCRVWPPIWDGSSKPGGAPVLSLVESSNPPRPPSKPPSRPPAPPVKKAGRPSRAPSASPPNVKSSKAPPPPELPVKNAGNADASGASVTTKHGGGGGERRTAASTAAPAYPPANPSTYQTIPHRTSHRSSHRHRPNAP